MDALRQRVEQRLPRPAVEVRVLLPYDRGDLVNKIHTSGEIISLQHTGEGTEVEGLVNRNLAAELAEYAVVDD
jgi:GTP-binding protein HflX